MVTSVKAPLILYPPLCKVIWGSRGSTSHDTRVELSPGLPPHRRRCVGQSPVVNACCMPCLAARARSWKEPTKLLRGLLCKQLVRGPGLQSGWEDGSAVQVVIKHQIAWKNIPRCVDQRCSAKLVQPGACVSWKRLSDWWLEDSEERRLHTIALGKQFGV